MKLALEVEAIARDSRVPWPTRRLAALVFETLLSRTRNRRFWIERLGATDDDWRRLSRNRRIHRLTSFDDFVAASDHECRLIFARYLFSVDDVVARIEAHLRRSAGERDSGPHGQFAAEAERATKALPAMERAIVEHLAKEIHWVAPQTPRTINALVENPAGTVVLTIKPPGSDVEIEIKRAGRPRARPLVIRRGGKIPTSHRLDGGSMHRHLVFEAKNSAFLSRVYREIHGVEAPICRTVAISRIAAGGAIEAMEPAQAIQLGTTSFRLDVVERYLRPRGGADGRFADTLLDEIVADYEPPRLRWRSHGQYVAAAFRANRARASATYVSALAQVGTFWGTLLGLRGYSVGESFVARNSGLRKVWQGGKWRVRVIFMDHDALSFASVGVDAFRPREPISNAELDGRQILGARGELAYLRDIYRAPSAVQQRGTEAFRAAMKRAYDRTHEAMASMPYYFEPSFVATLHDWDDVVRSYLRTNTTRASRARLTIRGYPPEVADEYVSTVTKQARFLRRVSFLF